MKVVVMAAMGLAGTAQAQDAAARLNDYPTSTRAEYVFACMAVNGENQRTLEQCSCSIDQIASILPYDAYVEAETILALQQTTGERAGMYRENAFVRDPLADLRRAQAEAEILCF